MIVAFYIWLGGFLLIMLPYIVFSVYVRPGMDEHIGYTFLALIWPVGVPYAIYKMFKDVKDVDDDYYPADHYNGK